MDFNSLVNGLLSNEKGATVRHSGGGLGFGNISIWIILFLIFCGFGNDFGGSSSCCCCHSSKRCRCHSSRRCKRRRYDRCECGCCDNNFIFIIVVLALLLCCGNDDKHHHHRGYDSLMDTNKEQLRTIEEN